MQEPSHTTAESGIASYRTLEIVVALILLLIAGVVIYDCLRIGIGWRPAQGPASGSFPFYMAVFLGVASIVNLLRALRSGTLGQVPFLTRSGLGRVLAVLLPFAVYVTLIEFIGVYAAASILIFGFMMVIGKEGVLKSLAVCLAVPFVGYLMFERWFLVPLPKSPFESLLGF
ncbi:MAG: tripartite tricarboxylate transporter TctB family protein [Hyphomicrobiaceae bacterium]